MPEAETQQETIKRLLKEMFPEDARYKPDFVFTKKGTISEQERYKKIVDEKIKSYSQPVTSFHEKPNREDVLRGAPIGTLVTKVYEVWQEGVIFHHEFEGLQDFYTSSVKLLGFNKFSEVYANLKAELEQIASEGNHPQ
jgi:hypothetical protein